DRHSLCNCFHPTRTECCRRSRRKTWCSNFWEQPDLRRNGVIAAHLNGFGGRLKRFTMIQRSPTPSDLSRSPLACIPYISHESFAADTVTRSIITCRACVWKLRYVASKARKRGSPTSRLMRDSRIRVTFAEF